MKKHFLIALFATSILLSCEKMEESIPGNEVPQPQLAAGASENYYDWQTDENGQCTGCSGKEVLDCLVQKTEPQIPQKFAEMAGMDSGDLKDVFENDFAEIDDFSSPRGEEILTDLLESEIYTELIQVNGQYMLVVYEEGTNRMIYAVLLTDE